MFCCQGAMLIVLSSKLRVTIILCRKDQSHSFYRGFYNDDNISDHITAWVGTSVAFVRSGLGFKGDAGFVVLYKVDCELVERQGH